MTDISYQSKDGTKTSGPKERDV